MKSIPFPEQTHVLAKDQPQYNPLPVRRLPDGTTTSCWEIEEKDMVHIKGGRDPDIVGIRIFVTQLTFGAPLQPLCVSLDLPPDCAP